MKLNDLYNNFKVIEQRLKKAGKLSSGSGNLALISSSVDDSSDEESDDDEDVAHITISTGSGSVTTASSKREVAGLGDSTFYAFLSSQSNGSILSQEDLDQIVGNLH